MQVLCKPTQTSPHIRCTVCGAGFQLYWERPSRIEQEQRLQEILRVLEEHHTLRCEADSDAKDGLEAAATPLDVHPQVAFTVPSWNGPAQFSGAALLGGFTDSTV
jgi:hypothetical protein